MPALNVPNTFSTGTTASAPEVNANFDAIESWGSTLSDDNFSSTAGQYATYRTLLTSQAHIGGALAAGTYQLVNVVTGNTPLRASGAALVSAADETVIESVPHVYLDDAYYVISGRTTKLNLRAQVSTNATAPGITFTFGWYPLTPSGAGDNFTWTLGTVLSGSTVAIATPLASTVTPGSSGDFTFPADGMYAPGVVTSGSLAAGAAGMVSAQLHLRWV
jgi:hypothetical protein